MIHINLLPEEYRRRAKTPFKLMLGVSGVVAVNASLAAWAGWLAFGVAARVDSEHAVLQTENDGLAPQVAYHQALTSESTRHKARETTLAEVTASRISWTRKLDEFVDVVNQGGEGSEHMVWFDDLTIEQKSDPRSQSAGIFRAAGHSGSDNFGQIGNFLDDLAASSFMEDFHEPGHPEGTESLTDEELMPPVVWSFPLTVELKTVEERKKDAAARVQAAAKAQLEAGKQAQAGGN
ncbi:MAG: hypothetical protein H6828_04485 [Planctomycetes bacterium]|nr:hypothetical protein [Planctomycetota bacterium]